MLKYIVSQPAIALCIESRSSRSPTTTSAPISRNACARSSSFRTIARTVLPCFNSSLVIVRPTAPTRPAAPVTKMGFAMFFPPMCSISYAPPTMESRVAHQSRGGTHHLFGVLLNLVAPDLLRQCPPGHTRNEYRHYGSGQQPYTVQNPLASRTPAMAGSDIDQRAEIDIHHRAGNHAEPGSHHIAAQLHSRHAKRIVQQSERNDRRETRQKNNLPPLTGDRPVNVSERLVLLDLPRDGITRQIAAHQKCRRGAQGCADGYAHRAKNHAEHRPSPKREHRAWNEQHRRHNVEADENHRPPRPKLANPVQRCL